MRAPVNLAAALATFDEHWSPRIVARYNDNDIRVVKVAGEFAWHSHPETDDLFLVLDGELDIELRDRIVTLGPGELYVVPRGVEHRPVARRGEVRMLLIEPVGTANTGDPTTATAPVDLTRPTPLPLREGLGVGGHRRPEPRGSTHPASGETAPGCFRSSGG